MIVISQARHIRRIVDKGIRVGTPDDLHRHWVAIKIKVGLRIGRQTKAGGMLATHDERSGSVLPSRVGLVGAMEVYGNCNGKGQCTVRPFCRWAMPTTQASSLSD